MSLLPNGDRILRTYWPCARSRVSVPFSGGRSSAQLFPSPQLCAALVLHDPLGPVWLPIHDDRRRMILDLTVVQPEG